MRFLSSSLFSNRLPTVRLVLVLAPLDSTCYPYAVCVSCCGVDGCCIIVQWTDPDLSFAGPSWLSLLRASRNPYLVLNDSLGISILTQSVSRARLDAVACRAFVAALR